jgi:hypothetical protein
MQILLAIVVVTLLFTFWFKVSNESPTAFLLAVAGWCCLILYGIGIPLQRMCVQAQLQAMQAIADTPRGPDYDSAAWRSKIADCNAQLAQWRYYNRNPVFDIFIPDVVDTTEFLK